MRCNDEYSAGCDGPTRDGGKCHAAATENFPAAWLFHYEPSPDKAPLVYYVRLFYQFFIPFVVIGLLLQILLHIWRVVVSR